MTGHLPYTLGKIDVFQLESLTDIADKCNNRVHDITHAMHPEKRAIVFTEI